MSRVPCATCSTALPAAPDRLVCWRCRDQLRNALDPDWRGDPWPIARLFAALSPEKITGGDGDGRRPPGFGSAVPINTHAVSLADHRSRPDGIVWRDGAGRIHHEPEVGLLHAGTVLGDWLAFALGELGEAVPLRPWTVARLSGELLARLDWCAGQDWIAYLSTDVRAVHAQLRSALSSVTGEHKPRSIGRCQVVVGQEEGADGVVIDVPCGTRLYVPTYGSTVQCRGCGSCWTRDVWAECVPGLAS